MKPKLLITTAAVLGIAAGGVFYARFVGKQAAAAAMEEYRIKAAVPADDGGRPVEEISRERIALEKQLEELKAEKARQAASN